MNTKNLVVTIAVIIVLVTAKLHLLQNSTHLDHHAKHRIAIFEPAIHPAIDEIAQGFMDTLRSGNNQYTFTRYNAAANKIIMRSQAEEILQNNYDLVFTIGVGCSLIMKELCTKQQSNIPLVFTAVDNPQELHLTGPTITGVQEHTNYSRQIELLLAIKPTVSRVLLVYDPSQGSGLEKDKEEIASILNDKKATLITVEIHNASEIHQKVSGFMNNADAILILKDHTAVSGIDSLIILCKNYHIPLLASDLSSGVKGAALAYGIREYDSGVYGAHKAKLIIEDNKAPSEIPVSTVEGFIMNINKTQVIMQGLTLNNNITGHYSDIKVH